MDDENEDGTTYEIADPASPDPEAESVKCEDRDRLHVLLKTSMKPTAPPSFCAIGMTIPKLEIAVIESDGQRREKPAAPFPAHAGWHMTVK